MSQWVSAYYVYMAVYLEKYPHDTRSMLQYVKTVRDIEKLGGSWRFYDEKFRLKMVRNPSLKWEHHNAELWNKAMGVLSKRPQLGAPKPRTNVPQPKGTCFRFHSGKHCGGCCWGHLCYKCKKGDHPHPNVGAKQNQPIMTKSLPTPIKHRSLKEWLHGYNIDLAHYLVKGFSFGFKINYIGKEFELISPNLKSAKENPDIVFQKIDKEISLGRVAGPFLHGASI